jgi:hypothetical protein
VPTALDPNDGLSSGGYYLPSDIEPLNQTRSDARTYFDPYCSKPNYNILVNSQVTRIIFEVPQGDDARSSFTNKGALYGISSGTLCQRKYRMVIRKKELMELVLFIMRKMSAIYIHITAVA